MYLLCALSVSLNGGDDLCCALFADEDKCKTAPQADACLRVSFAIFNARLA